MNLVLVLLLILITFGVIVLFFYDVTKLINYGFSQGLISALGSNFPTIRSLMNVTRATPTNTLILNLAPLRWEISVFISSIKIEGVYPWVRKHSRWGFAGA